ncbi:MAG: 5'-nucleotidase C-terminal domain-containing protein [Prevotella sp.]|nr:5'-nucleotidase C-terminal domain-containing protein [Prevotella sp.]
MKQKMIFMGLVVVALSAASCRTHYTMTSISRTRIVVDKRYDARPDAAAMAFIQPYRHEVDSLMTPVVGQVSHYMFSRRPESPLSNLLTDILMSAGSTYQEHPEFAVYNMGGIRAALAQGPVTLGDILDVAPFENKICFLTLSGNKVMELFRQIAMRGGEGVSHGVELVISKDGKLLKALIDGAPVDENKAYRVVTLDYLAQGNDQMTAFKSGTDVHSPKGKQDNVRDLITNYFRNCTAKGIIVDREVEGRIKIVDE